MNWTSFQWKTSAHLTARQRENLIIVRLRFQTQSIKLTELDWISDTGSVAAGRWGGTSGDERTCKRRLPMFRMENIWKRPFSYRFNCFQRWGWEKFPDFQVICAAPQTSLTCLVVALARLMVWLILCGVSGVLCMGNGDNGGGHVTTHHLSLSKLWRNWK